MSFSKESAVERAKQDLAQRLGVSESEIKESGADGPTGKLLLAPAHAPASCAISSAILRPSRTA